MNKLWGSILAMGLAAAGSGFAQDASKQPTPVKVSVGEITDSRSTGPFNSECKVELVFTGDAATDATSVRQVRVKKAVDETGRDLVKPADEDGFSGMNSYGSNRRGTSLKGEVRLRNPSRNATVIKSLEGEAELFNPTEANGGVLVIKDILKQPGEPVNNATLKKYGITILYLTKEAYEAKKKELESKAKSEVTAKLGEAFEDAFKGMFSGMFNSSGKNTVMFYVKDKDKRVLEIELQDANGKPVKRNSSWSSNEMRSMDFNSPPPSDAQLKIMLATPEAVKTVAFKVENVPLP